jgi:glycosyltransferase involved in cell wall biosynthesis
VVVVRNGIDRSRFSPRTEEPVGRPPLVLSVGRLVQKKGHETLVRACGLLASRGVAFDCQIVGEGPLRERLMELAEDVRIDGRLVLSGSLSHPEVRAAYDRSVVFVLPCRRSNRGDQDGLPVAIVEAMSVGVPVVATPLSGIPEVVRHLESGLLVLPEDPGALAAAIEELLANRVLRDRLRGGGWEVAAGFDLSACVERLRSLFQEGTARASVAGAERMSGAA